MARGHDIFISYARSDRERVRVLADLLARQGFSVWWDAEIVPGEPFDKAIKRALDGAKVVVAVWSTSSVDSDWVLAEADEGRRRKVLVPALIDAIEIPLGFRRTQAADLVGWTGDPGNAELKKLLGKIAALLHPGDMAPDTAQGGATAASPARWRARLRRRPAILAMATLTVLLLAAGAYIAKIRYDDRHFAALIASAETATTEKKFAEAERRLDEAAKLRPDDQGLLRARARWSEELRRHRAEPATPQIVLAVRDCPECPELVEIPAGSFTMGSPESEKWRYDLEGPQRLIRFERPFHLGRFEVTVGQFRHFVQRSGHKPTPACAVFKFGGRGWDPEKPDLYTNWEKPDFPINDNHPVVCVSWFDAKAYADWLSRLTGKAYRLPSEAEWEYAARGGTAGPYYWQGGEAEICQHANVADSTTRGRLPSTWERSACDDQHAFTAPVGRYKPNAFGLYDTLGNAWEWVADCLNRSYDGAPADGAPWRTGDCDERIMRGAAWISQVRDVRLANRGHNIAKVGFYATGFRVLREK